MSAEARKVDLPEDLARELEREGRLRGGSSVSDLAVSLLREGVRMRRIPGIFFVDSVSGERRAAIVGTGLEVWEIIRSHKDTGEEDETLKASYPWLSEAQLAAALAYYELYPDEIDERIERDERWTPEIVYREFPFMSPGGSDAPHP